VVNSLFADRGRIFQLFKYAVYALLTVDAFIFFSVEWSAVAHRFAGGIGPRDIIEGFASSIDTASWVILLLMFELETCVLEDRHFTSCVNWTLHGLRGFCYIFIVYAFYGYITKLLFLSGSTPLAGMSDICALVDGSWAYAVDLDEEELK